MLKWKAEVEPTVFVGGCADKRRMTVEPGTSTILIADVKPPVSRIDRSIMPAEFKVHDYSLMRFRGDCVEFQVFAESRLSADDVLSKLIGDYGRKD